MGDRDRLFRVIVLGGMGMLGVGAQAVACGETTGTSQPDAAGFPVEGASSSGPGFPMEGASSGSFPTEGTRFVGTDAGPDAAEDASDDSASSDAISDVTVDAEPIDATSGDADAQD